MPAVELINGKWVSVDGVRAEDLDGTAAPAPAPKKPAKPKAVAETPAGLTTKQQKEITTPKSDS